MREFVHKALAVAIENAKHVPAISKIVLAPVHPPKEMNL